MAVLGATFVASQPSVVKAMTNLQLTQPTEAKLPAAETPQTEVEKPRAEKS